jgi:integrase
MAMDTSARPHEILNLKIKDIHFKMSSSGIQYAEVLFSGKTKARTVPLLSSLPYVKEWINDHPFNENTNSWLFIALSKSNFGCSVTKDKKLDYNITDDSNGPTKYKNVDDEIMKYMQVQLNYKYDDSITSTQLENMQKLKELFED